MDRKRLLKILVYLIFIIFLVHATATKLYWYSLIWWIDMVVHFWGGFWIALLFVYVFQPKNISAVLILKILFFVFLVGIGWEIFEVLFNDIIAQNPFDFSDTSSDIFFDLFGGALASLYLSKKIMFKERNDVQ